MNLIALIIALGGFLMGFDTAVISGVVGFIAGEFNLGSLQVGWLVSSLTMSATIAMFSAGPLSDRFGRLPVLKFAAVLFAISAILSAFATGYRMLVLARMLGGLGVGASLIVAPLLIAEMAPSENRGRLVSFNQLNIVIGISVAFFSNYLVLWLSQQPYGWVQMLKFDRYTWRWMLGIETLPAIVYFFSLLASPESPRWLLARGRREEAAKVMDRLNLDHENRAQLESQINVRSGNSGSWHSLLHPALRMVLLIGIIVAILQQITGINAVFYYAPMIFSQSGFGLDGSFMQAVFVGIANLVFTLLALILIDRLGRKQLLLFGLSGITFFMLLLGYGFASATYQLGSDDLSSLSETTQLQLQSLEGTIYYSDLEFKEAMRELMSYSDFTLLQPELLSMAIQLDAKLIIIGIIGFVASFALSLGPVMWVLFAEIFPYHYRGKSISFVGLINSGVAFLVTLIFPWQLEYLGSATTFMLFGIFAGVGLVLIWLLLPETKGKSLEQLESELVGDLRV
jgi:SP family arabinose:H+ symporter-like MFS transporter